MDKQDWIIGIGLAIIIAIGAYQVYGVIYAAKADKAATPPTQEITSTGSAVKTAETKIVIMQQRQDALPEVVKSAKNEAHSRVDSYNSDDIAAVWNSRLEQYRNDSITANGL